MAVVVASAVVLAIILGGEGKIHRLDLRAC